MCDSARCWQATHHAEHRSVWASAAGNYRVFIGKIERGGITLMGQITDTSRARNEQSIRAPWTDS